MVSPRGIGRNLRLRAASRAPASPAVRAGIGPSTLDCLPSGGKPENERVCNGEPLSARKDWWARATRQGREFRQSLKTKNRAIAERRLREWLGELEAIAWGDKPRRSWEEAAAKFIAEHFPTIKLGAQLRYAVSMKQLNNHFAGKMLHQITSAEMSEFETKRRADGVSASTIRRDLACLSSLLTSAMDWEWIDANPVLPFLKQRAKRGLKEGAARTRYLTEDEEYRLIAVATGRERQARQADSRARGRHTGHRHGSAAGGIVRPDLEAGRSSAGAHRHWDQDQERPGAESACAGPVGTNPGTAPPTRQRLRFGQPGDPARAMCR